MNSNPPSFPARPMQGGELLRALKYKSYDARWVFEPKWNGWRALVHAPSGASGSRAGAHCRIWNRHLQPLTIAHEFKAALALLSRFQGGFSWLDCEALDRRHNIGRGSLVILDYIPTDGATYQARRFNLELVCATLDIPVWQDVDQPVPPNTVVLCPNWKQGACPASLQQSIADYCAVPPEKIATSERALYALLQHCNCALRAPVYEGLVAKRLDAPYPVQLRSDSFETPDWVKHRWPF